MSRALRVAKTATMAAKGRASRRSLIGEMSSISGGGHDTSSAFSRGSSSWLLASTVGLATVAAAGTLVVPSECEVDDHPSRSRCEANTTSCDGGTVTTTDISSMFNIEQLYELGQVLGEGAYGTVFRARRKKDGRTVALKTMPREYTAHTEFEREVAALQLLSSAVGEDGDGGGGHPHICKLYDLHKDDTNYYLAMELVEGGELLERLIRHGPYSEAVAASFLLQFAEALCFVHSVGLLHGDLKPENLLMSSDDDEKAKIKVVDFGCARRIANEDQDEFVGTTAYWSPELFSEGATPTPAADMWAAGIIVYILVTGSHPLDKYGGAPDDELEDALRLVGEGDPAVMDALIFDERIDGLSDSCVDLMRRLMHPDPSRRMTSDEFRRHPWVQGLTASREAMEASHSKLELFWRRRFREKIMKEFASTIGVSSSDKLSESDLHRIFQALDLKKNGVLEHEEIQTVFSFLGVPENDIREIFASADLDGSGVIHFDEFRALMTNSKVETLWQHRFREKVMKEFASSLGITGQDKLTESDLVQLFQALDLKKNGVLELEEIHTVFSFLGVPERHIQKIFSSADLDGTGVIRFDEFRALMRKHVDHGPGLRVTYLQQKFRSGIFKKFSNYSKEQVSSKQTLRKMFDAIDLDGNGTLDPHEIRLVLRSAGEEEDVISRIVVSVGLNLDGCVSWEEFLEIMNMEEEKADK